MGYITAIKTAILIFPLVSLLFTMPFILHQYHKYGSINRLRVLIVYSFILYMMCVYFLVILPLPTRGSVTTHFGDMMRLAPFSFVGDFIKESSFVLSDPSTYLKALSEPCVYTVLFNILMTIPFGMYLRYYFEFDAKSTILFSLLLSLFFELTQLTGLYFIYPGPYRYFDVDDLLMNTLGGLIGFFLVGLVQKLLPSRKDIDRKSLKDGMRVSGLRIFTSMILDLVLYGIISAFFRKSELYKLIFLTYFALIPIFTNGQTLGRAFLNIGLSISKYKNVVLVLRPLFVYFYYVGIPLLLLNIANVIKNVTSISIYINLIIIAILPLFYFINFIYLLKNRKMFYDRIFGVEYVSTIKVDYETT